MKRLFYITAFIAASLTAQAQSDVPINVHLNELPACGFQKVLTKRAYRILT